MTGQKTKRQSWVDFARGIAIILVVYRHVFEGIKSSGIPVDSYMMLEYFNIMFFSFRMPLFFIVSGIFLAASFAKRGLSRYVEVKARTILFPYLLWGSLQISLQIFFSRYVNSDRTAFDYLYLLYDPRQLEQFWYLYALFNVSVLYVIFKYVFRLNTWQQFGLGLIMFYAASYLHQRSAPLGFVMDILHNYVFIAIGDLIHKYIRDPKNFRIFQSRKLTLALLIPFVASQLYFLLENLAHPEVDQYRYIEYYRPTFFLLIALTGCAFTIAVCFLLQKKERPEWLRVVGTHSLHIYVAHVIAFASVRALLRSVFNLSDVPLLLITGIISGLLIPILMYRIAKKINMEWVFSLPERALPKREKPLPVPNTPVAH